MLHLYHFFRPKTHKSSPDEITKHVIDCWDSYKEVQYYNGYPLYITRDGNDVQAQYGACELKLSVHYVHFQEIEEPKELMVFVGYKEMGNERIKGCDYHFCIDAVKEVVRLRETQSDGHYGFSNYDIDVPFEFMNETDFFQFETLNPVLPISREVLVKLVDIIRKDMGKV